MEAIEILSCFGCRRTIDQFTLGTGCTECGSKLFKQVKPTKMRILCWFFNNPKHVAKLFLKGLWEKINEKRSKHCSTGSTGS